MSQKYNIKTYTNGVEINGRAYERGHVSYDVKGNNIMLIDQEHEKFILNLYTPFQDILINGVASPNIDDLTAKLRTAFFRTQGGGTGPQTPAIGIAALKSELETNDGSGNTVFYVRENKTVYQFEDTDPGNNSGTIAAPGGFWVPQMYRTRSKALRVGENGIPGNDTFFNDAILTVITPADPLGNTPVVGIGVAGAKVAGSSYMLIDFPNGSHMIEIWHRSNIEPTDWPSVTGLAQRALVNASHTRQIGYTFGCFTISDPGLMWSFSTPPMRPDALLFTVANGVNINQKNNHADLNNVAQLYVSAQGFSYLKAGRASGTLQFAGDLIVTHQAETYEHTGPGANITLPDPLALDVWNKREFEGMIKNFINTGTGPLVFNRQIKLDGGDTFDTLNYMTPGNTVTIKCINGAWTKI